MNDNSKKDTAEYFLWKSNISGPFDLKRVSKELFKRLQKRIPNAGGALMIASKNKGVITPSVFIDQEKLIYRAVDKLLKKPLHEFEVPMESKNPIAISLKTNEEIKGSIEEFCLEMIPKNIASKMGFISKRRKLMAFPIDQLGVLVVSNNKALTLEQTDYVRQQKEHIADTIRSISAYKDGLTKHLDRIMKLQRIFGRIFTSSNLEYAVKEAENTLALEMQTKVRITLDNSRAPQSSNKLHIEKISHEDQQLGWVSFRKPIKQTDLDMLKIIARELGLATFVAVESIKSRERINDLLIRGFVDTPETPSIKFTLRLTPSLNSNIELLASQEGKSKADYMRELLQQGVDDEMGIPRQD